MRALTAIVLIGVGVWARPGTIRAQDPAETQYALSGRPTPITLRMPGGVPPYRAALDLPPDYGVLTPLTDTVMLYTAPEGFAGLDRFVYAITDATGARFTQQVTLHILPSVGSPPDLEEPLFPAPPALGPQLVPDTYILSYLPGTPGARLNDVIRAQGGVVIRAILPLNAVVVRLPAGGSPAALLAAPEIAHVEPDLYRYAAIVPDDTRVGEQWALNAIDAFDAWTLSRGTGQVIAVLDTGVALTHSDLNDHLLAGYDFVGDDTVPAPDPAASNAAHGTHVHGIANAETDNARGIAGVAWDARSLHLRIIGPLGATASDIAAGIVYATDHGADVINLSLAGPGWVRLERDAVNYAAARGVILVAAAGNENTTAPYYPASYDHVLSVAATGMANGRASFSNRGFFIDLAAPGSAILSTIYPSGYDTKSGTSMAAPHVAGAAALVRARGAATTPAQVAAALLCTALDLGAAGRDNDYGWGLLQADGAVRYVPAGTSCLPAVPHDDLDTARVIAANTFEDVVDTTYATSWTDDPRPCSSEGFRTVWYQITPHVNAVLTLDTQGSSYDTVLALYKGVRGSLQQVACNNDFDGLTSWISAPVLANETYSILVSSRCYEDPLCRGTLHLTAHLDYQLSLGCQPAPTGNMIICAMD